MRECERFTSMLMRHLATGEPLPDEWRTHVRDCAACSAILQRAERLAAVLEQEDAETETDMNQLRSAVEDATRAEHRRALMWRLAGVVLIAAAAANVWHRAAPMRNPFGVTAIVMVLVTAPLALIWWNLRRATHAPRKLYKRMAGHEVSGVCAGIADALGIPAWTVRFAFVMFAWLLSGTLTIAVYLILDLALQIHPEDRDKLWRFRIRRWWRNHFAAT